MDELLTAPVNGSGYNPDYGILGSNKATEGTIKLFPIHCQEFVDGVQADIKARTGKTVEVMVYGDGAFKDPVGKIWELADPVVSPGFTDGLVGQPNELKLKYLADNDFSELRGDELKCCDRTGNPRKGQQSGRTDGDRGHNTETIDRPARLPV